MGSKIPSPCVDVCKYKLRGHCIGCGMTKKQKRSFKKLRKRLVRETRQGKFQNQVVSGDHQMLADEPTSVGGLDSGPSPYDYLSIALGTCTSMTLRMYADRKGWELGRVSVVVDHDKVHADDCAECEGREGRVDRFVREISVEGDLKRGATLKANDALTITTLNEPADEDTLSVA